MEDRADRAEDGMEDGMDAAVASAEVAVAIMDEVMGEVEGADSFGACASRLRPKAIEKTFPPIIGESETKPQFSEKCARSIVISEIN